MKKFLTILTIFATFLFVSCATLSSVKGRNKFAEEHNMTVILDNEQMFYAVEESSFEQKSYIVYGTIPYEREYYTISDGEYHHENYDISLRCYYVDGEFNSEIKSRITNEKNDFLDITLRNETAYLLSSTGGNYYITPFGYKKYTAMLKYYRAKLLVDFNREFGIFIPEDKKKEYQLEDVDKLKQEFESF